MEKIYSRKRFVFRFGKGDYQKKYLKNTKKIKVLVILVFLLITIRIAFKYVDPMFETLCKEKLKVKATIITNQQSTIVMNNYKYEELYTIERDETGNVTVIRANVVPVNKMISDLTENIQNEFEKMEKSKVYIPVGSLTGSYLLMEYGPSISVKFSMLGTVETEIKSEFVAQGINQTLHRVFVNFNCEMKIATPLKNYKENVTNQVLLAEHVIVGNIPDTYYNFDGVGLDETLNVIK